MPQLRTIEPMVQMERINSSSLGTMEHGPIVEDDSQQFKVILSRRCVTGQVAVGVVEHSTERI